jgi:hypothetical protein
MGIGIDRARQGWCARPLLTRGRVSDPVYHRLRDDVTAALSLREDIDVALSPVSSSSRGRWIWLTMRPLHDLAVVTPPVVGLDDDDGDHVATTVIY